MDPYFMTNVLINVKIIGLIFTIIIYIVTIVFLYFRRKTQIILNRSPFLLITSIFLSFFTLLGVFMILFLPEGNSGKKYDDEIRISYHCWTFNYNINVNILNYLNCYLLRSFRLNKIYDYKSKDGKNKNDIKEKIFMKIFFMIFFIISFIFIVLHNFKKINVIVFDSIPQCQNKIRDEIKEVRFWIHTLISSSKIIMIIYGNYLIYDINDQFYISYEISLTLWIFLLLEFLKIILNITEIVPQYIGNLCIVFLQTISVLTISGIWVIYKSYEKGKIPVCNTIESIKNFNLLLYNEKALKVFFEFIRKKNKKSSLLLISLFKIEKNINNLKELGILQDENNYSYYNSYCDSNDKNIEFNVLAKSFANKEYFNIFSDDFESKIANKEISINSLYRIRNYILNHLNDEYFDIFKEDNDYIKLKNDLEIEEIIYDRLCRAKDMDFNLTDSEFD